MTNRSDETVVQRVYSSNGNPVDPSTKASGKTSEWKGVKAGNYKVHAKIASTTNCNGWAPGNGNLDYRYTITF